MLLRVAISGMVSATGHRQFAPSSMIMNMVLFCRAACTASQVVHVNCMQELQGLNRHAEGALQRVEATGSDPAAYFSAVEQAVGAYETASQQVPAARMFCVKNMLGH